MESGIIFGNKMDYVMHEKPEWVRMGHESRIKIEEGNIVSFQVYYGSGQWPEDEDWAYRSDSWRMVNVRASDVIAVIERHHFYKGDLKGPVEQINPEDFEHNKIATVRLVNGDEYLVWDKDRTAKDVLSR